MDYNKLIEQAANHVQAYIDEREDPSLSFHNSIHVKEVVEAVRKISAHYQLGERDSAIVKIAAYFHDIGYYEAGCIGHEMRGADLAEAFLRQNQVDEEMIVQVRNCILATKPPQDPKNLLEEIVCDADLYHLGSDWFTIRNKLMRREAEATGVQVDKNEWRRQTIKLLENHKYHTSYCRNLLEEKKQANTSALKQKELEEIINTEVSNKQKKRPDRGIETMFRITSTNNQRLSDMADNKANILITVNSIILSVVIALLLRKLDNNAHLIIPTAILLTASLGTMVLAILATRPSIPNVKHSVEEVKEKKVNLLFFGNFYKMQLPDYDRGMREVMEDRDYLYGTLIKDVYSQGVVLGRKFKLLRQAYSIFMYGLIVSVIAFIIVVMTNVNV